MSAQPENRIFGKELAKKLNLPADMIDNWEKISRSIREARERRKQPSEFGSVGAGIIDPGMETTPDEERLLAIKKEKNLTLKQYEDLIAQ